MATGAVKDFRTLARLGHVSPARISQIVSLLHLAPDIREALLFRTGPERGRDCLGLRHLLPFKALLHFMGSAFAIENVSRFSGTFTFTPLRLVATADVGANLVAADTLLFGRSYRFF